MAFTVRDLLNRNLLEGAELVAGKQGLNAPILWANVMEILDATDSLQPGELLVTTGYQLEDEQRFQDLILRLKSRGVCAAAIQPGYYISEIPRYLIEQADRYGFPLLALPTRLTFSEIMHLVLENIREEKQHAPRGTQPQIREQAIELLRLCREAQQTDKEKIGLFIVSAKSSSNVAVPSSTDAVLEKIKSFLKARSIEVIEGKRKALQVYACRAKEAMDESNCMVEFMPLLTQISREDRMDVHIGFSLAGTADSDGAVFDRSFAAYQMLFTVGVKKGACCDGNIRLFEWFRHFEKENNALSFAYDALKPVIAYDAYHRGELLQTLRVYLANACRISETAQKLFVHRHTLNNRIERISQLCGADFGDCFTRLHFSIALLVYDYFLS